MIPASRSAFAFRNFRTVCGETRWHRARVACGWNGRNSGSSPAPNAPSCTRLCNWKRWGCPRPTPIQIIFGPPFGGNVPTPMIGRKKAPKTIALNFSRNVRSTSSGTLAKKPSVRCILSGSIQRTPRIWGSRSTRRRLIDSGRSIATKSRLLVISLFAGHFVITQGGAIGEPRHPCRNQTSGFRSRARFIAFILTGRFGEKTVHDFHRVAGQIRKKRIPKNGCSRGICERERGLTTTTGSENFSRSALGIHGDQRRSSGSSEPGEFGIMPAFEFCIHVRAGSHHSWSDGCYINFVQGEFGPNSIRGTGERKF